MMPKDHTAHQSKCLATATKYLFIIIKFHRLCSPCGNKVLAIDATVFSLTLSFLLDVSLFQD